MEAANKNETDFERRATAALQRLTIGLEEGIGDRLEDIELSGGILVFEIEGAGKYVLNKNGPKQQLWLASPKSGAWHFAFDPAKNEWLDTRQGQNLIELLSAELGQPGRKLDLSLDPGA